MTTSNSDQFMDTYMDAYTTRMRNAACIVRDAASVTTFVHAAISTTIQVADVYSNDPRFHVILETIHRDTGEEISIQLGDPIPISIETAEDALNFIYARVRAAWLHELNEAMHVLGVRRRDLHEAGTAKTIEPEDL